ncbi:MAG: glycosyltransferase family 2 protein [Caldilineae bacterium]|nr:MAG: glycosyltransferase family 2 protein [Caldilineae bacterium]
MPQRDDEGNGIVALIPAYNEAAHIEGVVRGVRAYLPALVVDDGSTDETAALATAAGAQLLHQPRNRGKGHALRAGFRWALEQGYRAVLTLDADGQHDPADIPLFLNAYRDTQADLIIGTRDFHRIPGIRRFTNSLGRVLFSWAIGQDIPDNQSGFRLLSRRMVEAALAGREGGFEFEVEMIVACVELGYKLAWVPIRTIYAGERSHISPLKHTWHFLRMVAQTRRRLRSMSGRGAKA